MDGPQLVGFLTSLQMTLTLFRKRLRLDSDGNQDVASFPTTSSVPVSVSTTSCVPVSVSPRHPANPPPPACSDYSHLLRLPYTLLHSQAAARQRAESAPAIILTNEYANYSRLAGQFCFRLVFLRKYALYAICGTAPHSGQRAGVARRS